MMVGDERPIPIQKDSLVWEERLFDESADGVGEDEVPGLDGRGIESG